MMLVVQQSNSIPARDGMKQIERENVSDLKRAKAAQPSELMPTDSPLCVADIIAVTHTN